MKHKSNIITFVLAVALLGSSCTSVITEVSTDETHAISFQTPKTRTRAAIDDATDMTDGFSVWGWYRKTDAGPHNVFDGVTVKLDNGSWTYDETQYWIPGWTYDFYAVHPVFPADGPVASVASDGTISITNFDCSKTGAEAIDLMTAQNIGITYKGDTPPSPVDLKFSHELAKVNFVVKSEVPKITVTSVKVFGVHYKGNFNQNSAWTNLEICNMDNTPFRTSQSYVLDSSNGMSVNVFGDILLIPNIIPDDAIIEILYRFDGETTDREAKVKLSTESVKLWVAGNSYSYTIMLKSSDLQLNVSIIDWTYKNTSVEW